MRLINFSILLAAFSLISGCGISKSSLGFNKQSPNEYSLLKQQPLTIPPNFDLVPPQDKKNTISAMNEEEFDKIFYNTEKKSTSKKKKHLTHADKAFLNKTKKHNKREDIKNILEKEHKETQVKKENKPNIFSKLLGKKN